MLLYLEQVTYAKNDTKKRNKYGMSWYFSAKKLLSHKSQGNCLQIGKDKSGVVSKKGKWGHDFFGCGINIGDVRSIQYLWKIYIVIQVISVWAPSSQKMYFLIN